MLNQIMVAAAAAVPRAAAMVEGVGQRAVAAILQLAVAHPNAKYGAIH